jgi:hypothetical protein
MMVPAYGGQKADCISHAFGHIPGEAPDIPPTKRLASLGS